MKRAFSLLEILVAVAVTSVLLFILLGIVNQTTRTVSDANNSVAAFQSARNALNLMQEIVTQASLNAYLDYDDPGQPTRYERKSDQRFVVAPAGQGGLPGTSDCGQGIFFQAPAVYAASSDLRAAEGLLNICGFYVDFAPVQQPAHVTKSAPWRYQLMYLLGAAEANTVYHATGRSWITNIAAQATPIAENVIALVIRPQDPAQPNPDLAPLFLYDTGEVYTGDQPVWSHQLPPVLDVTAIVIDERSASRIENGSTPPAAIVNALAGRFEKAADYLGDLAAVEQALREASPPISYRIFKLNIPIKESKWSP